MPGNIVDRIDDKVKIRTALLSVFDKKGMESFITGLVGINPDILLLSTGGTFVSIQKALGDNWKKNLMQVSDYTGQPETQGGLVKTLDFKIYLGLLTETYNPDHRKDLERTGARQIDMAVVNLYPFAQVIQQPGVTVENARANIDIGGPCMVRASAKNYIRTASVVDPLDYDFILRELSQNGGCLDLATRFDLAKKAFAYTSAYDAKIAAFLGGKKDDEVSNCYRFRD
jgi:phosphoribosylaminoimidazolecarboxamide formyltransferase / IMP cyclohydrolase